VSKKTKSNDLQKHSKKFVGHANYSKIWGDRFFISQINPFVSMVTDFFS